jgi:Sec-independent protein translocase protein TatA
LYFGAKRVPGLARSLGVGARELEKAGSEKDDDSEMRTTLEKQTASEKNAGGGKGEAISQDVPSERGGDRAQREPQDL